MKNKQDWRKEFDKTILATQGGSCWECCGYEAMVEEMRGFIQKQLTKAYNKGKREGVNGFVYYLFPIEMYHSNDVKDEFWWSRGDAFIEAEKYLKSLKNKK